MALTADATIPAQLAMNNVTSSAFRDRITQLMSEFRVPGLAIAVTDGVDIHADAFGYACLDPEAPTTTDTIFDVASMSKSFTAASVLKLILATDKYDISLETPVSTILPGDFQLPDGRATEFVTVEDILSHRSGMPGHDNSILGIDSKTPDTLESVTRNMRNLHMNIPPRTKFQYNNQMYTIATYVVEVVSGQELDKFLQDEFFEVLGMTSSFLQPNTVLTSDKRQHLSVPYDWSENDSTYIKLPFQQVPNAQGAGSIQSTVVDYAKWLRAMIKQSEPPLTEEMYNQLTTGRTLVDPDNKDLNPFTSFCTYALGWEIEFYRGYEIISHGGGIPGYGSFMCFLPALKFGFVMMSNSVDGSYLSTPLVRELIDDMLQVRSSERIDWISRMREMKQKFDNENKQKCEDIRNEILALDKPAGDDQILPLPAYVGKYSNLGYHEITISIQDDQLYVDGLDRSEPFTIIFERVSSNRYFIAHHGDYGAYVSYTKAEFEIGDNGEVERVGIAFVSDDEGYLVWFSRVGA